MDVWFASALYLLIRRRIKYVNVVVVVQLIVVKYARPETLYGQKPTTGSLRGAKLK